jgi:hypothetical protein
LWGILGRFFAYTDAAQVSTEHADPNCDKSKSHSKQRRRHRRELRARQQISSCSRLQSIAAADRPMAGSGLGAGMHGPGAGRSRAKIPESNQQVPTNAA